MNDTSENVQELFQRMLMDKSSEERLKMGCSMFTTAREIIKSSIRAQYPDVSTQQMKQKIFLRFYADDFSDEESQRIQKALAGAG